MKKILFFFFFLGISSLGADIAHVGVGSSLVQIDTTTSTVIGSIPLPGSSSSIAITPNQLFAYAIIDSSKIAVIDLVANTVFTTIDLDTEGLSWIAINPDGKTAYVTNSQNSTVILISTERNQVTGLISGFPDFTLISYIAINPNGTTGYVNNIVDGVAGSVSELDLSLNRVATFIGVENYPYAIAIPPNGKYIYVTNANSNLISILDPVSFTVIKEIFSGGAHPLFITATPDSKFMYVSNQFANNVSVVSTETNNPVSTIPISGGSGSANLQLAITSDGLLLYQLNSPNIQIISTTENQPVGVIPLVGSCIAMTDPSKIPNRGDIRGKQIRNDFGVTYEYFNRLEWKPVTSIEVVHYDIYRNGIQIANVSPKTFRYEDHNQKKGVPVLYSVLGVSASGETSLPISIIIR